MKTKINFRVFRPIVITLLTVFCVGLAGCSKSNQVGNANAVQNTTPPNTKAQPSPASATANVSGDAVAEALAVVEVSYKDGKVQKPLPNVTNRTAELESLYNKLKSRSGNLDISELGVLDSLLYTSKTEAADRKRILNSLASLGATKNGGAQNSSLSEAEIQENKKLLEKISKNTDEINTDGKRILTSLNPQPEGSLVWYWKNAPLLLSSLTAFVLLVLFILKNLDIPSSSPKPVENAVDHNKSRRSQRNTNKTPAAAAFNADNPAKNDSPETPNSESEMNNLLNLIKSDIANEVVAKLKPEINNIKNGIVFGGQDWTGSSGYSESTVENDGRVNDGQPFETANPPAIQKAETQAQSISFPSFVEEIEQLKAPRLNYEPINNIFVEADNGNFYLINDGDGQICIIPALKYFMKKTDYIPFGKFYYQSGESGEDGRVRIDVPATVRKEAGSWRFTGEKGSLSVIA